MVLTVIDVGSNAIRMSIAKTTADSFDVIYKHREPIRLGADVFASGSVSEPLLKKTISAFKTFHNLSQKYKSKKIIAIATSALRNAKNQKIVVENIAAKTGIHIDIISGQQESELAFKAINHKINLSNANSLLVDIGGGSVELVAVEHGQVIDNCSFPIGTVRLLNYLRKNKKGDQNQLEALEPQLAEAIVFIKNCSLKFNSCVGIGGNLERMGRINKSLDHKNSSQKTSLTDLKKLYDLLSSYSLGKRMVHFDLKSDQADVIIPALVTMIYVMETAGVEELYIPGVGIREGLFLENTLSPALN